MAKTNSRGSITAELVLALPTVALLIALAIGALGLQLVRIELVAKATELARAFARGDSDAQLQRLTEQLGDVALEVSEAEGSLCVKLTASPTLPFLGPGAIVLSESQCARVLLD